LGRVIDKLDAAGWHQRCSACRAARAHPPV